MSAPAAPQSTADLLHRLDHWTASGALRELDRAFVRFLAAEAPDAPPLLLLAAALASHQLGRGHVCLDLAATLADSHDAPDPTAAERPESALAGLSLARWLDALADPRLVGSGAGDTPLVREGNRLYLRRYWQHEHAVRTALRARLAQTRALREALPATALRAALDALFAPAGERTDWQKIACALCAGSAFSLITGGPGTGKTTTVVRLLALLQSLALETGGPGRALRIRLAAPTGKAAARLSASIAGALAKLADLALPHGEAARAAVPSEVTTLHRLLGSRPDSRHFRHDASHPLALDVLVVDEASMIDLELMSALLAALPAHARLVLLGDKDQLASVEAGAVLGELCARAEDGHYLPATAAWLQEASGERIDPALLDDDGHALDQAIVMLRHSHRFDAASGIGELASAVNRGMPAASREVWRRAPGDLVRLAPRGPDDAALKRLVLDGAAPFGPAGPGVPAAVGYRRYLERMRDTRPPLDAARAAFDAWATQVLDEHARFQVLCAVRTGPWGVEGLNQRIAGWLAGAGLIATTQGWYAGRPVLVTRNDYDLGLMNGDVGLCLMLPHEGAWQLRVAFSAADGSGALRWLLPSRLQEVDSLYAMTVHKSQGSEFSHTALILPDTRGPLLTRELVYTGITRARHWLSVVDPAELLEVAMQRRVQRASGLGGLYAG